MENIDRKGARLATQAIERMYITMRHLFNRGYYKPMGVSGTTLRESLLQLRPEIYGSIAEEKVELTGLLYVLDRLPQGIEECSTINLTGDEGYRDSNLTAIVPPKRRRNCYRIDKEQMNIEITRGRSDIYDVLTHLTFVFIESHKIAKRVVSIESNTLSKEWKKFEETLQQKKISSEQQEIAIVHAANIIGRTYSEVKEITEKVATTENPNRFLKTLYWLGKLAIDEYLEKEKRTIMFSAILRERVGHHIHGEIWANNIKNILQQQSLLDRNLHIISANMHSVMNCLYAKQALPELSKHKNRLSVFQLLSNEEGKTHHSTIKKYASEHGLYYYKDTSGSNIDVQIIDLSEVDIDRSFMSENEQQFNSNDVLIVMDYAFGEQAFETMDELLKPVNRYSDHPIRMKVKSISIMGKAGILSGNKGDIMVPKGHIFEGTSDNYPFKNELSIHDFENHELHVFGGHMITVLGTSLQNREMLCYFKESSWQVTGLEMEGAHYQKAIQAASKIRGYIQPEVKLRYAYYASDNPLETGSTLASGGLGLTGVKPTYLITTKILYQILTT